MKCEACKQPLRILDSKIVSPVGTEEVTQTQYLACVNEKCKACYDKNNPVWAKIITNKL